MQVDRTLERDHALAVRTKSARSSKPSASGAQDYLTKPFEKTELDVAMLKCRQKKQLAPGK